MPHFAKYSAIQYSFLRIDLIARHQKSINLAFLVFNYKIPDNMHFKKIYKTNFDKNAIKIKILNFSSKST